jgi:hypothetical protein
MNFMNFPFVKSRLRKAIERGMVNGNLDDELDALDEITVKSRADGEAICWALRQLNSGDRELLRENIKTLSGLMDDVNGDVPACAVLREQGIPELCRLFDLLNEAKTEEDDDTLLSILYTLAMSRDGGGNSENHSGRAAGVAFRRLSLAPHP